MALSIPARLASGLAHFLRRPAACAIVAVFGLASNALAGDVGAWTTVGPRVPGGFAATVAVNPSSGAVLAGGYSGVSRSSDGGATWTDSSAGLTFRDVRSLAIDPRTPSVVYAGTSGGGVFKSVDAGASWHRLTSSPESAPLLAVAPLTPSTLYAASFGPGVYKSTDAGATWSHLTNVPVPDVLALAVDPTASGTVWVGGQWDLTSGVGLARTTDGGVSWSPIALGPGQSSVEAIAIAPSSLPPYVPGAVYVGRLGDPTSPAVCRSTDGGASWFAASDGLPVGLEPRTLVVDPRHPLTVYLGTNGFFRCVNGGLSWESAS